MAVFPLENSEGGFNTAYRVKSAALSNSFSLSMAASANYYSRTQGTGASRRIMTFSFWYKSVTASANEAVYITCNAVASLTEGVMVTSGKINLRLNNGLAGFVDSSVTINDGSWHHVVVQLDTPNATATSRCRMWKDGTEDTSLAFTVNVTQNYDTIWGSNGAAEEGMNRAGSANTFRLDELAKIDNSLLGPTNFASGGKPIDLSGLTFGSQGYWIRYETGVAATGGNDSSGNGLNFTNHNYVDGDFSSDVP